MNPIKDEVAWNETWGEVLGWIDYAAPTRIKRMAWQLMDGTNRLEIEVAALTACYLGEDS